MLQEDISKLRRKIEKAKKPAEKISNGDDILNEEINDYKVGFYVGLILLQACQKVTCPDSSDLHQIY